MNPCDCSWTPDDVIKVIGYIVGLGVSLYIGYKLFFDNE
jgi:hypothetical protein